MSDKKYYDWIFFQKEEDELASINGLDDYIESYYLPSIQTKISIRIYQGKQSNIYYHDMLKLDYVKEYHHSTFGATPFYTLKHLQDAVTLHYYDANFDLANVEFFTFDRQNREVTRTILSKDYQLLEHTEAYYRAEHLEDPYLEKTFYANVWHKEDNIDL